MPVSYYISEIYEIPFLFLGNNKSILSNNSSLLNIILKRYFKHHKKCEKNITNIQ